MAEGNSLNKEELVKERLLELKNGRKNNRKIKMWRDTIDFSSFTETFEVMSNGWSKNCLLFSVYAEEIFNV